MGRITLLTLSLSVGLLGTAFADGGITDSDLTRAIVDRSKAAQPLEAVLKLSNSEETMNWLVPAMSWSINPVLANQEVTAQDGDMEGTVPGLKKGFNQILAHLVENNLLDKISIDESAFQKWKAERPKNIKLAYAAEVSSNHARVLKNVDELTYFKALEVQRIAQEKIATLTTSEDNKLPIISAANLSPLLQNYTYATLNIANINLQLGSNLVYRPRDAALEADSLVGRRDAGRDHSGNADLKAARTSPTDHLTF